MAKKKSKIVEPWESIKLIELTTPYTDINILPLVEGVSDDSFKKACLWDEDWLRHPQGRSLVVWDARNILRIRHGDEIPSDPLPTLYSSVNWRQSMRERCAGIHLAGSLKLYEANEADKATSKTNCGRKASRNGVALQDVTVLTVVAEPPPLPKKKRGRPKKEVNLIVVSPQGDPLLVN